MLLMQSLTVFMYFMLEPLLCASCCIFSSSLQSSGYEVLPGCAMPKVQGVRESVSTGFQKAWHCCTRARKYHEVSLDLETFIFQGHIFHFHDFWEECLVLIPYQLAVTREWSQTSAVARWAILPAPRGSPSRNTCRRSKSDPREPCKNAKHIVGNTHKMLGCDVFSTHMYLHKECDSKEKIWWHVIAYYGNDICDIIKWWWWWWYCMILYA